jgi:hypothetical protein
MLSRLSDLASDADYQPNEIDRLLADVWRAQTVAERPSSIRALDKPYRVATWAERDSTGLSFDSE